MYKRYLRTKNPTCARFRVHVQMYKKKSKSKIKFSEKKKSWFYFWPKSPSGKWSQSQAAWCAMVDSLVTKKWINCLDESPDKSKRLCEEFNIGQSYFRFFGFIFHLYLVYYWLEFVNEISRVFLTILCLWTKKDSRCSLLGQTTNSNFFLKPPNFFVCSAAQSTSIKDVRNV